MALNDYAGLLAALARFSVRGDQAALWPDCVALAEAEFNRAFADKALRPMLARASARLDEGFETPPADLLRPVALALYRDAGRADFVRRLDYLAPGRLDALRGRGDPGEGPGWYTLRAGELEVFPAPDGPAWGELTYVQKLPALSAERPSNWLLAAHPDAYLYGALVPFALTTEDERLGAWAQAWDRAVTAVVAAYPAETDKARLRADLPRC